MPLKGDRTLPFLSATTYPVQCQHSGMRPRSPNALGVGTPEPWAEQRRGEASTLLATWCHLPRWELRSGPRPASEGHAWVRRALAALGPARDWPATGWAAPDAELHGVPEAPTPLLLVPRARRATDTARVALALPALGLRVP